MAEKISLSLLEKHGSIEAFSRQFFEKYPKIKKALKRYRDKNAQGSSAPIVSSTDPQLWIDYRETITQKVNRGDIILVHSSTDGLERIGVSAEQCMIFLKKLVKEKDCTIVMPCFPITNLKPPTEKSRPYDPKKTLCWTGMLANTFIADPAVIRTRFPYNSLAAIGSKAEEMMAHDLDAILVYDENSAWRYCCDHHAKIMFLGVKASGSNTMAIHMLPDYMGDEWPINDWYEVKNYKIKSNDGIIEIPVKAQRAFWYRFVMEEGTSGRLKIAGLLEEKSIGGCNLGVVPDSLEMLNYLASEVEKKKLTYLIPKKYYKKQ